MGASSLRVRTIVRMLGVVALAASYAVPSWAKQEVTVTDDSPIPVAISSSQLTLIKMPSPVLPNGLMTVNPMFEIKANGTNVAIDPKGTTTAGDLVVMTEHQSYLFQLVPKPIPAETIIVRDARLPDSSTRGEPEPSKHNEGYVQANVELLRETVQGTLPKSCVVVEIPKKALPRWLELTVVDGTEFRCSVYTVRRYRLYNNKNATQSLRQTEFFTGAELSIALDRHVIEPAQDASVYIVVYTSSIPKEQKKPNSPDPEPWKGN